MKILVKTTLITSIDYDFCLFYNYFNNIANMLYLPIINTMYLKMIRNIIFSLTWSSSFISNLRDIWRMRHNTYIKSIKKLYNKYNCKRQYIRLIKKIIPLTPLNSIIYELVHYKMFNVQKAYLSSLYMLCFSIHA